MITDHGEPTEVDQFTGPGDSTEGPIKVVDPDAGVASIGAVEVGLVTPAVNDDSAGPGKGPDSLVTADRHDESVGGRGCSMVCPTRHRRRTKGHGSPYCVRTAHGRVGSTHRMSVHDLADSEADRLTRHVCGLLAERKPDGTSALVGRRGSPQRDDGVALSREPIKVDTASERDLDAHGVPAWGRR